MFLKKSQHGQSTVEYIILVTAVIGLIIAFLIAPNSTFKARINSSMDAVTNQANAMSTRTAAASNVAFTVNAVATNIIGNQVSGAICAPGTNFDPSTGSCF